jgi:NADPH-dependent curcumin reductase CurA
MAGQIAKIAGARVVGIAGGPQKCRAVVEDFGFDACIDYKNDTWRWPAGSIAPGGLMCTSTTSAGQSSTRYWAG